MNKRPLISILVNCYNSETYLKEALDSIYKQTYQNFEILLIDNCSADQTAKIAKSYDQRLRYYKTNKFVSLYAARNFGVSKATGDYLAFLDSDDIWKPNKLEIQLAALQDTGALFIYTNFVYKSESSSSIQKILSNLYLYFSNMQLHIRKSGYRSTYSLVKYYDINLQTVLLSHSLIQDISFLETLNLYGDLDFFLHILLLNKVNPYYLNEITSVTRIHPNQLSKKNINDWYIEAKLTFKHLSFFMDKRAKRKYIINHIFFHYSNILVSKSEFKEAFKIKIFVSLNSFQHFIHLIKTLMIFFIKK